jgi:hypothetical protein
MILVEGTRKLIQTPTLIKKKLKQGLVKKKTQREKKANKYQENI